MHLNARSLQKCVHVQGNCFLREKFTSFLWCLINTLPCFINLSTQQLNSVLILFGIFYSFQHLEKHEINAVQLMILPQKLQYLHWQRVRLLTFCIFSPKFFNIFLDSNWKQIRWKPWGSNSKFQNSRLNAINVLGWKISKLSFMQKLSNLFSSG